MKHPVIEINTYMAALESNEKYQVHLFLHKVSKTHLANHTLQRGHPASWSSANSTHTSNRISKNKVIVYNGS